MSDSKVLSLQPLSDDEAGPAAARLYRRARADMKMVPNMYRQMAHAPALLETYMDGYGRFRRESGFTSVEQEVVLLAISKENGCAYCLAAHSFVADTMSGVPRAVTDAIRDDGVIPDSRLAELARFVRLLANTRGRPSEDDVRAFVAVGFTETQVLFLLLAIAMKTISNYTNHLCNTEVDGVFKVREWRAFKVAQALKERLGV